MSPPHPPLLEPTNFPRYPCAHTLTALRQIESIFNPIRGPRDAQLRAGVKPVNHSRNNILAMKEQSQMNALQKHQEAQQQQLQQSPGFPGLRSTSARRPAPQPQRSPSDDGGRNFVQENKMGAVAPARALARTPSDDGSKYLAKRDYGRVPAYLVERKMEMAADYEASIRAKEAALIPPGMRMLDEEERLETLAILTRNRAEIDRAIQGLPIIIETPGQIRRKDELERRLQEIEDAFRIFCRPKVMVHA
ncbi:MAG: hypothetical protein WDW36_004226 [Sanguina aurantia]